MNTIPYPLRMTLATLLGVVALLVCPAYILAAAGGLKWWK